MEILSGAIALFNRSVRGKRVPSTTANSIAVCLVGPYGKVFSISIGYVSGDPAARRTRTPCVYGRSFCFTSASSLYIAASSSQVAWNDQVLAAAVSKPLPSGNTSRPAGSSAIGARLEFEGVIIP